MPENAEFYQINDERLIREGEAAVPRYKKSRDEILPMARGICAAKRKYPANTAYGEWLRSSPYNTIGETDRKALIKIGNNETTAISILQTTNSISAQTVWTEINRNLASGKPKKPRTPKMTTTAPTTGTGTTGTTETATNPLGREPHAPGTTPHVATADKPEPAPEQPAVTATGRPELLSKQRKKQAAPKTDLVRTAVRELLLAGKTINRGELASHYKSSEKAVQLAHWSEVGRIEGYTAGRAAGLEEAIANNSALSATAQQKYDAFIGREIRRLNAEHTARMAQIDEDVRQRVVAQGKAYAEEMLALSKKARATEASWRRLINNRQHLFTTEQYTAILRCLHPDSRDAVSPERLGTAFNLFKEKKFLMTGEED